MPFPERVTTPRLTLRRPTRQDQEAFVAVWTDPTVWAALHPGRPVDRHFAAARFEHHLDHWATHQFGVWAVGESDEIVGIAGASHPDFVPDLAGEVELGWTLRRESRGRGVATEAARAARDSAFAQLRLDRVISLIERSNERSFAVARRLGMTPASRTRHPELCLELVVMSLARPTA
jgi:RimJ/RimL family protein N-acetyltransferase